jgi:hypothetical protein
MKKINYKVIVKATWITLFSSVSFFSCIVTNKIYEEYDIVHSAKRIELKLAYRRHNMRSPIAYAEQSIIKEISNNGIMYKVYDALILTNLSYQLEDKVFIIIDNEVLAMEIDKKEFENTTERDEKRKNIATSDSTSISVVTGYSEYNSKITRFNYKLPGKMIDKIRNTDKILFRYYAGPSMLTISLDGKRLIKLKQLIDKI